MIGILLFLFGTLHVTANNVRPLLTPPMGWKPRLAFDCEWDCKKDPVDCLNELLYVEVAEILFRDGYRRLGYTLIQVDDCPDERIKDQQDVNTWRFPTGIRFLSNYFHERGLNFGLAQTLHRHECILPNKDPARMESSRLFELRTDFVEMDMCELEEIQDIARNAFVYCNDQHLPTQQSPIQFCDIYHPPQFHRLEESWRSVSARIDQVIKNQDMLIDLRRSGKWVDFGELLVGSDELTVGQWRIQMSMWCILSAPLMISIDMRSIDGTANRILTNKHAIDVDQDRLGEMGRMVKTEDGLNFFVKRIEPCQESICSYALVVINRSNRTITTDFGLAEIGIANISRYQILDVWSEEKTLGTAENTIQVNITAMDSSFFTITPIDSEGNLFKKQSNQLHSQLRRTEYNNTSHEDTPTKPQTPSKYEKISSILSTIFDFELIWLGGISISVFVLCLAIRIDRRNHRFRNAPKLKRLPSI